MPASFPNLCSSPAPQAEGAGQPATFSPLTSWVTLGTDSNSPYLDFVINKHGNLMPRSNRYQIWGSRQALFKGLRMLAVAIIILI